jgi:multicomponent Na+:H+ antiporter subunit D
MGSNLPILLFLIPFLAAMIAAAVGWFVRDAPRVIAVIALGATAALSVVGVARVHAEGTLRTAVGGWPPPYGIEVLLDPLSAFIAAMVGLVALLAVVGALPNARAELPRRNLVYYSSILLLVSGLMGITITGDLFNLFVQIEVASLSAYALVAAGGRGAPRAALNYLVIGSLGASLYLIGVGFLFAATGSLNMEQVAALIHDADERLVLVGGLLIVAGLGTKMALFPFHVWMPAAYSRAPAAAAAVMAPLVTKVSAYALLRILFWVFAGGVLAPERVLLELVAWAGAAAVVGGGILALVQTDLRRLLAYSSVGQMGVVALGIGLANPDGLTGAVLHIANDALMKGALFLAAGLVLLRYGVREVSDLSRVRGQAPWTAAAVVVAGLSLIGVPPLSGFFGKWYVLSGAVAAERWIFVVALLVGSLATVGYVFRIIEPLFFGLRPERQAPGPRFLTTTAACVVLALGMILVGVFNEWIVSALIAPALPGVIP